MPSCFSLKCTPRAEELTKFTMTELERATQGFSNSNLLGEGSYGRVYKATLDNGKHVAVKRPILEGHAGSHSSRMLGAGEFAILSKVHCSNVVNLIGFSHHGEEVLLVVELMKNGNLHDALHTPPCSDSGPGPRPSLLNWRKRARFLLQVAKAISALHAARPQIIHRDVKSSNVLIDAKWNARLGDFGLAVRGDAGEIKCTPAGTTGYFDPLYESPDYLSTKVDVFSFGVLVLETVSGRLVMDEHRKPMYLAEWALALIKQNKPLLVCDTRLTLPSKTRPLKKMVFLAARCIRTCSPFKRPTMMEVVRELTLVTKSLSWRRRNMPRISCSVG